MIPGQKNTTPVTRWRVPVPPEYKKRSCPLPKTSQCMIFWPRNCHVFGSGRVLITTFGRWFFQKRISQKTTMYGLHFLKIFKVYFKLGCALMFYISVRCLTGNWIMNGSGERVWSDWIIRPQFLVMGMSYLPRRWKTIALKRVYLESVQCITLFGTASDRIQSMFENYQIFLTRF